jgi:hypothetical protein
MEDQFARVMLALALIGQGFLIGLAFIGMVWLLT